MSEMGTKGPLCLPKRCFPRRPLTCHLNRKVEPEAFQKMKFYPCLLNQDTTFAEGFEFTQHKLLPKNGLFDLEYPCATRTKNKQPEMAKTKLNVGLMQNKSDLLMPLKQ